MRLHLSRTSNRQAADRSRMRRSIAACAGAPPVRGFGHAVAEARQLLAPLRARSRPARPASIAARASCSRSSSSAVKPRDGRASRLAADTVRRRAGGVELLRQPIDHRRPLPRQRAGRSSCRQPQRRALEMLGQRCPCGCRARAAPSDSASGCRLATARRRAATRRTRRARPRRRSRSAPAGGAAPCGSSARNTDRCPRTRPSAERRSPPSPTRARTTGRRRGSDVRRSSGRGRLRSRGSSRSALGSVPRRSSARRSVRSGSTCSIAGVSGAMTRPGRRSRRRARCRRARRSCAASAPRPSRRSRRTGPTPSRRPWSVRSPCGGLRTSMRGRRAAR